MTPTRQGSIRLFRFAGIDLYLHWSWFLAPVYAIKIEAASYSSPIWPVLYCLALFLIVLLHEFGHAAALKARGGEVHEMGVMLLVLMPVPYVDASSASLFRSKFERAVVGALLAGRRELRMCRQPRSPRTRARSTRRPAPRGRVPQRPLRAVGAFAEKRRTNSCRSEMRSLALARSE